MRTSSLRSELGLVALFGMLYLPKGQAESRKKLYARRPSSISVTCNEVSPSFTSTLASVSSCTVKCMDDQDCKEVIYNYLDSTCEGWHAVSTPEACWVGAAAVAYVTALRHAYLGCFKDYDSTAMVALGSTGSMTIEYCYNICIVSPIYNIYFGLQIRTNCYCGGASTNYTKFGKAVESDCSMACAGNAKQICGGRGRLSVYQILH